MKITSDTMDGAIDEMLNDYGDRDKLMLLNTWPCLFGLIDMVKRTVIHGGSPSLSRDIDKHLREKEGWFSSAPVLYDYLASFFAHEMIRTLKDSGKFVYTEGNGWSKAEVTASTVAQP